MAKKKKKVGFFDHISLLRPGMGYALERHHHDLHSLDTVHSFHPRPPHSQLDMKIDQKKRLEQIRSSHPVQYVIRTL